LQALHEDSTECAARLAADRQAIDAVIHDDAAVRTAADKLAADTAECLAKLAADRHQLAADMQKLREDVAHRCTDGDAHHAGDAHTA
jgi:hypothetical protein